MILFKCTKCGAVIDAQDQYAGCEAACTYCGTVQTIPSESDPACVLIFTEESPATGTPMTSAELNTRVEDGSVRPYDLIWTEGMWQPLCAVFEMNGDEVNETPPANCEELATDFSEMEPLPGCEKLPRLRQRPGARPGAPSADTPEDGGRNASISMLACLKIVAAVAVVLAGAVCALRVFNTMTGRSAILVVRNSTPETMRLQTPWANQEEIQLAPFQYANVPSMDMAFGRSRKLSFVGSDAQAEGGDRQELKVAVAPACITVVNLGRADFPLLNPDFDAAKLEGAVDQAGKTLVQQLQSNVTPVSIQRLCDAIDDEIKSSLREFTSQECFFEKKVCLDLFIAGTGRNIKPRVPRTANDKRPLLLPAEGGGIDIGNGGSVSLSPKLKCIGLSANLGMVSVTIGGQFAASGEAALKLTRDADRGEISALIMFAKDGKHSFAGQTLRGKWRCLVTFAGGTWQWRWELLDASGACRLLVEQDQAPKLQ